MHMPRAFSNFQREALFDHVINRVLNSVGLCPYLSSIVRAKFISMTDDNAPTSLETP